MSTPQQMSFDKLWRETLARTDSTSVGIDFEFPVELANELAQQEVYNKHLFRPNTYMHKWWARRCGTTFRAILKQLTPP